MSNSLETGTNFRRTLWRTGYDVQEVDAFTAEVEVALFSPEPRMSASDVATQQFTEVRRWPGYDTGDVDKYLEEVENLLSKAEHRLDPHPFRRDLRA